MTHKEYFPADKLLMMEQALSRLDENSFNDIAYKGYKSPITALLLSAFGGILGFDRFYIGDTGMGVGKLLTGGGCGIWALIDIFMIQDATREKNFELISRYLWKKVKIINARGGFCGLSWNPLIVFPALS